MVDFKTLKKNRSDSFAKINAKLKAITTPTYKDPDDDTFWEPVVDKAGNGFAVIRFMPTPEEDLTEDGDALPIVQWWSHGFQGPGGWYIEKSRTTLGEADPCSEMNSEFWNSGDPKKKEFVSGNPNVKPAIPGSKRKENFAANITVVSHPARPEDEGKQFRYKFGKKIFTKINDAQNPKLPTDTPFNPFDLWEGANFALAIGRNDGGFRGYDNSKFLAQGPLYESEEKMEMAWKGCYSLSSLVKPEKFKTYEQLKARLAKIMGSSPVTSSVEQKPSVITETKKTSTINVPSHEEDEGNPPWDEDETDDDMESFKNLLKDKK